MALQSFGLDFFYLDVNFFNNDKVLLVEQEYGSKATLLAVKLLCRIYRDSYYYQWGRDTCLLFTRKQAPDCPVEFVQNVVDALVERGFFHKEYYAKYGILTSEGIQLHYFEAVQRRKQVEVGPEYLLVDTKKYKNVHVRGEKPMEEAAVAKEPANGEDYEVNDSDVYILQEKAYISGENVDIRAQSKGKESTLKVKERKYSPSNPPKGKLRLDEVLSSIPQDGVKRNCRGLVESLQQLGAEEDEVARLVMYCDYGVIGHSVWLALADIRTAHGQIKQPLRFLWSRVRKAG